MKTKAIPAQSLLAVVGGLSVRHMVETNRAAVLSATVARAVDAAGRATAPTKVISLRDKILVFVTTRGDVHVH